MARLLTCERVDLKDVGELRTERKVAQNDSLPGAARAGSPACLDESGKRRETPAERHEQTGE